MKNQLDNPKTCLTCKHFRLHYIKYGRSYSPIHEGHCVYPRLKQRRSETEACQHYSQKDTPDKNP